MDMSCCVVGLEIGLLFFPYLTIFLSFKAKFVSEFSQGTVQARIFKYGIRRTHCSYFSLYLSIFLSFKVKLVSLFSQELFKLESSNMECICRMSDCIMGLRIGLIAPLFYFDPFFFLYNFTC